jgi:hypothetical protein
MRLSKFVVSQHQNENERTQSAFFSFRRFALALPVGNELRTSSPRTGSELVPDGPVAAKRKKKKPQIKVNLTAARALPLRNCKLTQIMTKIMFYYLQWLQAMVRLLVASPDSLARDAEPNNVRNDCMTMCLLSNHFI